ncbi:MAG: lipopolysaccharide biosynthesis protein [Euryarchaeota archaeon]|nr:lipopolysaccharide biosynthesis protein [Euryarchaeota archaeon]
MSLATRTTRNLGMMFFLQTVSYTVTALTVVALAWFLSPRDYGIIGISAFIVTVVALFGDLGITQALIHRKGEVEAAANTTFVLQMLITTGEYLVIVALSPFTAAFFAQDPSEAREIILVVCVSALSLFVGALGSVHSTLFSKRLEFGPLLRAGLALSLTTSGLSLLLAWQGFGYWSFVGGTMAGSALQTVLFWKMSPFRPSLRYDPKMARELLGYGRFVILGGVLIWAYTMVDKAMIGKLLGVVPLGLYYFAFNLANTPALNVTHVVISVLFPTFSNIREDRPRLVAGYLKALRFVGLIAAFFAVGFLVVGRDFVTEFLHPKWQGAIVPLQILAIYGLARSLAGLSGMIFNSVGRPEVFARIMAVCVAVTLPLIPVGMHYLGLNGAAAVVTGGMLLVMLLHFQQGLGILDLPATRALGALGPAALAAALAVPATWALRFVLEGAPLVVAQVLVVVAAFGAVTLRALGPGGPREVLRQLAPR